MDIKKTIDFADHICEDARGDLTKMNRIGANKAFKFYQDNVVMLGTVSRDTFVACYPQFVEEIEGIRVAAEKAQEAADEHVNQGDRIAALEVKLDKLTNALTRYMEADIEEEEEEEDEPPKRKRGRPKKKAEIETEEESPPADDAEGEAETDEA